MRTFWRNEVWQGINKGKGIGANVCGYTPVSLGKLIKGGILSDITSIHRITIDRATEKKEKWHGEAVSDN